MQAGTIGVVPVTAAGRHYRCCSRYGCRQEVINMSSLWLQADITGVVPATAAGRK